ncbi:hypothetical protein AAZX31_20G037700 [Glycine max]
MCTSPPRIVVLWTCFVSIFLGGVCGPIPASNCNYHGSVLGTKYSHNKILLFNCPRDSLDMGLCI